MNYLQRLVVAAVLAAACACTSPAPSAQDTAPQGSDAVEASPGAVADVVPPQAPEASTAGLKSLADPDPQVRSACRAQCIKNHAACRETANSPEARNECFDTYNDCMDECG